MRSFVVGALLVSITIPAAFAGQPSAVLPQPGLRPSLPISVAPAVPQAARETPVGCDLQSVMRVENGKAVAIEGGVVFDAYGLADSASWLSPHLMLSEVKDGIATIDFVACAPTDAVDAATPVETHMAIGLGPDVRRVIIRSRTNTLGINVKD